MNIEQNIPGDKWTFIRKYQAANLFEQSEYNRSTINGILEFYRNKDGMGADMKYLLVIGPYR